MNTAQTEQDEIEAAAADWLARADRGLTQEELLEFARWRAKDPRHEAAATEIELVWGALDALSAHGGQQRAGGVVVAPPASAGTAKPRARAWWLPALGLAAALVIATVAWWRMTPGPLVEEGRYATEVGEQRVVTLADGSSIRLNTHTALSFHLRGRERRVVLERGEAFFEVKADAARPFTVVARRLEARVVGTAFAVRIREADSVITITEGKVQIGAPGRGTAATLSAQQQATVAHEGDASPRVRVLVPDEIARHLAWRRGTLEFSNTPLGEAIEEFNRYYLTPLRMRDPAMGQMLVGGSHQVDNREGFVRLMESAFDVIIVEQNEKEIVLGVRP